MSTTKWILAVFFLIVTASNQSYGQGRPGTEESAKVDREDAELNTVYKELISKLDSTEQAKLRESERAWIKQRDVEAARMAHAGGATGGSAYRVDYLSAVAQLIHARTEVLKRRLVQTFSTFSPGVASETPGGASSLNTDSSSNAYARVKQTIDDFRPFEIRGLYIGMPFIQLSKFCSTNAMEIKTEIRQPYIVPGIEGQHPTFARQVSASNGKLGSEKIELRCVFATPIPGKETAATMIEMTFRTGFGAGANIQEIVEDLKKKYGAQCQISETYGISILWQITSRSGLIGGLSASLNQAPPGGEFGDIEFNLNGGNLDNETQQAYQEAIKEIDANRPRNESKPSF